MTKHGVKGEQSRYTVRKAKSGPGGGDKARKGRRSAGILVGGECCPSMGRARLQGPGGLGVTGKEARLASRARGDSKKSLQV